MQQPATNATDTQLQLVSSIRLTRRSLAWPTVSAALIPSVVAPRLRATGLPCIASLEIEPSGNTQQHGTEITALLILAWYKGLILHRDSRPSGTHGAAGQYVHYLMNMAGASITRNYAGAEDRHSGTPWYKDTDVDTA